MIAFSPNNNTKQSAMHILQNESGLAEAGGAAPGKED